MLCYSSLVELEYFENLHKPLLCCDTFYYVLMCKALKLKESILSFSITVCTCMHTSVLVVSSNFFLFFFLKLSATFLPSSLTSYCIVVRLKRIGFHVSTL